MGTLQGELDPVGPSTAEILRHAGAAEITAWIFGALATIATLIIWFLQRRQLRKRDDDEHPLCSCTQEIVALTPRYAVTAYLALFFIRSTGLMELVRALSEASAIHHLFQIMVLRLGGRRAAAEQLGRSPRQLLAVPPCCCCCSSFCPVVAMDAKLLRRCRLATTQFFYVVPTMAVLSLWVRLQNACNEQTDKVNGFHVSFDFIKTVSVMVAFYGLMIMYTAAKDTLSEYSVGLKVLAVKALVILNALQSLVIGASTGFKQDEESANPRLFQGPNLGTSVMNVLLCIEAPLVALLMWRAFPPAEVYRGTGANDPVSDDEKTALL